MVERPENRDLVAQLGAYLAELARGNLGTSIAFRVPVARLAAAHAALKKGR